MPWADASPWRPAAKGPEHAGEEVRAIPLEQPEAAQGARVLLNTVAAQVLGMRR